MPKTRYRITRNGRETWRDEPPTDEQWRALEQYCMATNANVRVERVTTRLLDNVPMGLGKIHSDAKLLFEWEG